MSWPGVASLRQGPPPTRFSIPYSDDEVDPRARYSLLTTVRQHGRLLYSTDTVHPVLDGSEKSMVVSLIPVPRAPNSPPPHQR